MTIEYGVKREHLRSDHGRGSRAYWLFSFATTTEPDADALGQFTEHIQLCYPPKAFPGPNLETCRLIAPSGPSADVDGEWCTLYEVVLRTESTS